MHHDFVLLKDIVLVFSLAVGVLFFAKRLHIPIIVGYLFTGILAGPTILGILANTSEVEMLAEIGVVLLLFAIGIEFSLDKLLKIKGLVLGGGAMQVFLTAAATFAIAYSITEKLEESVLLGFLVALSSTAIVLKVMQERGDIESPKGRLSLAILIFQDIIMVPIMLAIPFLAGDSKPDLPPWPVFIGKAIVVIVVIVVATKWIVPKTLYYISATRSRELFMLAIITMCFGVALISVEIGLSLALGAFLAGLIVSETDYSHHALGNVAPFRDIFISLFFISIGMLLDLNYFADHILIIVLGTIGVFLLKSVIIGIIAYLFRYPIAVSLATGMSLSQVGEFSFVLSKVGLEHHLLSQDIYQLFLSVSIVSMAATPFVIAAAPRLAEGLVKIPILRRFDRSRELAATDIVEIKNHIVIVGFGFNGRNLARAAKAFNIPYIIVEMNPETVRREKEAGEPIVYGDAAYDCVLESVHADKARIAAVAIPDPAATREVVAHIRGFSKDIHIIARTRFVQETKRLLAIGANEVIPEEYETSVEVFSRALRKYNVPRNELEAFIENARSAGYAMFRSLSIDTEQVCDWQAQIPDMDISRMRVMKNATVAGRTLSDLNLRNQFGATVLAIHRNRDITTNPGPETHLEEDDIVVLLADPERYESLQKIFSN